MPRIAIPAALLARLHAFADRRGLSHRGLVAKLLAGLLDAIENPSPRPRWELSLRRPEPTEPDGATGLGRILAAHPRWTTEPAELADDEPGPAPCRLLRDDGTRVRVRWLPRPNAIRLTRDEPDRAQGHSLEPDAVGVVLLDPGEAWLDLSDAVWAHVLAEADRIADRHERAADPGTDVDG